MIRPPTGAASARSTGTITPINVSITSVTSPAVRGAAGTTLTKQGAGTFTLTAANT